MPPSAFTEPSTPEFWQIERRLAPAEERAGADAHAVVLARKADMRDGGIGFALLDQLAEPLVGKARDEVDAGALQVLENHAGPMLI